MRGDLIIDARVTIPASDLSWRAARSGGPGGQHVNKVSTKIELRFDLASTRALDDAAKARLRAIAKGWLDAEGRVIVTSELTRAQSRNLADAREKLAALIRRALVRPKVRRPTKPTRAATRRRLEEKRRHGSRKASRRERGRERGEE